MKPELAALLLVEEYDRQPTWWDKIAYRNFLKTNANRRKLSRWHGYYLAVKEIERGQKPLQQPR